VTRNDDSESRAQDGDDGDPARKQARRDQVRFYVTMIGAGLTGAASLAELVRSLLNH
jgi:hypothetical protein